MTLALIESGAEFSPDRVYRYRLWRRWEWGPMLAVVGLNPSTADEATDDPTVRRCIDYARRWGFAGLEMLNLFAFRATDPMAMLAHPAPVGPENLRIIRETAGTGMLPSVAVLAAWGAHGSHLGQAAEVVEILRKDQIGVACLGLTKDGQPRHPLYLRRDAVPIAFVGDGGRLVTGMSAT